MKLFNHYIINKKLYLVLFLLYFSFPILCSADSYRSQYNANKGKDYIEITGTLRGSPGINIIDYRGYRREYCVSCHKGIEEISSSHPKEWGCTICHMGKGDAIDKEDAHSTLLYDETSQTGRRNPSSLRVVEASCGLPFCHSYNKNEDLNHIKRVKNSVMSTQIGIISTIKYLFGESAFIKSVPEYMDQNNKSRHRFSDSKWESSCSDCHLWSEGKAEKGRYRAQGCATCHVLYDEDGLYKGNDPTVSKKLPGHPSSHKMTVSVPSRQCNICHQNSSTSVAGITFEGIIKDETGQKKSMAHLQDIHFSKGLECIDCHTLNDIMGDGNLHLKGKEQVEIKCQSCHGDFNNPVKTAVIEYIDDPVIKRAERYGKYAVSHGDEMVLTEKGNKFSNVKREGGKVVLYEKLTGKKHNVPQLKGKNRGHTISAHNEKLECTACHSLWVPQHYGKKNIFSLTEKKGQTNKMEGIWEERFQYSRIFSPQLGINSSEKVSVFSFPVQVTFTAEDERGKALLATDDSNSAVGYYNNFIFTTFDGKSSAIASFPVFPHSTQKKVRSCEDCHLNPKTLGLGEGKFLSGRKYKKNKMLHTYDAKRENRSSLFPYDVITSVSGSQVAATGFDGARGFNKEELKRIFRVGLCITCHDKYTDPIYQDIAKSYKKADGKKHKKIIAEMSSFYRKEAKRRR